MIDIFASLSAYRVAAAELPLSARLGSGPEAAVVVMPGKGQWAQAARAVFDRGAAAVVISEPDLIDDDECDRLQDVADGRPVIVDRAMFRADLAETAVASLALPSYVAVDLAAADRRAGSVRDAVGWMRVLLGGRCVVQSAARTPSAGLVLVQREDAAVCGVLSASTITGADEGAWIRAVAVAETRVEVVVDEADARAQVDVTTVDGVLRAARRFEARERLSLRRAITAIESAEQTTDLADLRADAAVAEDLRLGRADKQH